MEEHAKVKGALEHLVRDRSEEGRRKLRQTFELVIDAFRLK